MYKDIASLLEYAKGRGLFIQLDTNGLSYKKRHYEVIANFVDLLGLPLDGGDASTNQDMRNHKTHFERVTTLLQDLANGSLPINIKINTVVSNVNADKLHHIARTLSEFDIKIWSLYQFWPIGEVAKKNHQKYTLSTDRFLESVACLQSTDLPFQLEISPFEVRHSTYFFVSQTGATYTIDRTDPFVYTQLGSIFDDRVLARWAEHSSREENADRIESRLTLLARESEDA